MTGIFAGKHLFNWTFTVGVIERAADRGTLWSGTLYKNGRPPNQTLGDVSLQAQIIEIFAFGRGGPELHFFLLTEYFDFERLLCYGSSLSGFSGPHCSFPIANVSY
jgi:hypothetical protein